MILTSSTYGSTEGSMEGIGKNLRRDLTVVNGEVTAGLWMFSFKMRSGNLRPCLFITSRSYEMGTVSPAQDQEGPYSVEEILGVACEDRQHSPRMRSFCHKPAAYLSFKIYEYSAASPEIAGNLSEGTDNFRCEYPSIISIQLL